jgi:hypothetical protein
MPEIRNEIPTDDELREYLLASFPSLGDDFSYLVPECIIRYSPAAAEFLLLPSLGFGEFWHRAAQAVFRSLQRLNELPRDDPFWQNTNRRPTLFKLHDHCARLLRQDTRDEVALWTVAALDVFYGSNDFGRERWATLRRTTGLDIRWPVYAALYTELHAAPSAAGLAEFLWENAAVAEAAPLLRLFAECPGRRIRAWSLAVRQLIDGGRRFQRGRTE